MSIRGRVFNTSSNLGISDLVVTIFDVGPGTATNGRRGTDADLKDAVRFASLTTDMDGRFVFNYFAEDVFALNRDRDRMDMLITVAAPDDETSDSSKRILYRSEIRRRAGKSENFNIGISPATLKKFGLDGGADTKETFEVYRMERTFERDLEHSVVEFHKAEIEKSAEEKKSIRTQVLNSIATNLDKVKFAGELVRGDASIKDKSDIVVERAVDTATKTINGTSGLNDSDGVEVNLYLLPSDIKRLKPFFDSATDGIAKIPEFELTEILARANSSENPGTLLVQNNPVAAFCVEQSEDGKCALVHTGIPTEDHDHAGESSHSTSSTNAVALTNENVKEIASSLLSDLKTPDFVFGDKFGEAAATQSAVDRSVGEFVLGKGPADVPAYYDFHSLQIAFEHVWKVLVDEEIVNTAHELDRKYKKKTGLSVLQDLKVNLGDLVISDVYPTFQQEIPANVAAQFDISIEEWVDLAATHRSKLIEIANDLVESYKQLISLGGWFSPTGRRLTMLQKEKLRQDLREQGERLIDAVRHDDYYTLHKTLRDLQNRINSAYEFTVFAADKNFHSVNFGLMNTYRQKWCPINYQAGKLIKTIPLSPKEERKYTVKTTRNLKLVKKEAVKNNSSQTAEQNSTSRVESEIMDKAHSKTNFGLSTEGTYNIGISKGKSTTTFGVEAQSESAASRKDFREAVLKAVQEYKDERSIEINSEDSSSYEYSESGSIVNPNDELSVTYLFYELQRRYRISEQLYRVMPVVLVAQEVPAPHEITEAWVIANDWIINRFLLDDSFRPALQYLANRSVGDDFALRELRKNLRQQRNLVETLRIELSSASDEAENRYRALENAIERRIQEEEAENSDGLFSDIGDFFGGGGQNPEAMKARELAAKDAHQYAVEKSAKAAAALKDEVNNLHRLTAEYNTTLRDHLDCETKTKRLVSHIRSNITYYMQAIWSMEPPDQRYLRLHKVEVPVLKATTVTNPHTGKEVADRTYSVKIQPVEDVFANFRAPGTKKFKAFIKGTIQPANSQPPKPLVEVADLDSMLGFKGNYMIFPLKEHNALTEFMAAPYVDQAFGAMDPEELSNVNLEDYSKFVCCLFEKDPKEFKRLKPELKKWLERLLADPLRNGDEIVIPTGSLFIESLVGTYPLLENFKRRHREMDALKVAEEVRAAQMRNLRLAARLVNDEREDPDIESVKNVFYHGPAPHDGDE
ncbi:MAG TPA: hypothetical protein VJ835_09935 [Fimbriimonadaceae bacterium]|nr:hypothetical protein [Fimbriimonadaceae bacterium]